MDGEKSPGHYEAGMGSGEPTPRREGISLNAGNESYMPFCRKCGNQVPSEARICSRCCFPRDVGQAQPVVIGASPAVHVKRYAAGRFALRTAIALSCIGFAAFAVFRVMPKKNAHAGAVIKEVSETARNKPPQTCEEQEAYIAPLSKRYAAELDVYLVSSDAQTLDARMSGLADVSSDFSKAFTSLSPDTCGNFLNFLKDESLMVPMFTQVLIHRPKIGEESRQYANNFLATVVTDGEAETRNNQPTVLNDWLLQVEKDYCRIRTANFALQSTGHEPGPVQQDCGMHKLARGR